MTLDDVIRDLKVRARTCETVSNQASKLGSNIDAILMSQRKDAHEYAIKQLERLKKDGGY